MHAALCYADQFNLCDPSCLTLVFLTVPDEKELSFTMAKLGWYGIEVSFFCEPDLNDELTAFAAGSDAGRRLSKLPLALGGVMTMEESNSWLQAKVVAQAAALDRLHSRVVNQRFQLRTLNNLGRGLTKEEFLEAVKLEEHVLDTQTVNRIGEP
jgi:hypothetical protein